MHKKEKAIAPVLSEAFNIQLAVATKINTDAFGSFSGEVERKLPPIEAARKKIQTAVEQYKDADLFIANEGSFFPHPDMPYINIENEVILLIDYKNKIEVKAAKNFIHTQSFSKHINSVKQALDIANKNSFPQNGIILKTPSNTQNKQSVYKDISNRSDLKKILKELLNRHKEIIIESDLRAHKNKQRMQHIAETTRLLVENMLSHCPKCKTPGFAVVKYLEGLPCASCGMPTRQIKAHIKKCEICQYEEQTEFTDRKADAGFCDYCNP